ncbi:MAG: transcriptional regulator [Betaproteobacteria bacterium]|nr:transcriptional regulator [Betaproteobacteria bacterium]
MGAAHALFSESQGRLFRWLFGQPERSFHLSELRRLTGLGSASLQRELRKLALAGLVTSERVGNLRRFQANPKNPIFGELIALTRKVLGFEPMLREALSPLMPRLQAAWVFGSIAKQSDTATSDVDVMVIGEELTLGEVLERLLPLEAETGRKFNPTCYTPAEFARRRSEPDSFVNRVLSQPTLPLIGQIDELAGAG